MTNHLTSVAIGGAVVRDTVPQGPWPTTERGESQRGPGAGCGGPKSPCVIVPQYSVTHRLFDHTFFPAHRYVVPTQDPNEPHFRVRIARVVRERRFA